MTAAPGRALLARRCVLALLALLLCWRAVVALGAEVERLGETSLIERRAALSADAAWRYRTALGPGAGWLAEVRTQLVPGNSLMMVHDGSIESERLTAGFTTLLFPLTVHSLTWPADAVAPELERPGGALVAHIGRRGRFTESLLRAGMIALVQRDDFQLYGPRPDQPLTKTPVRMVAPPPPPGQQRLAGFPLLLLVALPLLWGGLALQACGIGPRTDALAFWGWAWMAGCLLLGVALLAWLLLGLPLAVLTPTLWGWVAALSAAGLAVGTLRGVRAPRAPAPPARGAGWERAFFAVCVVLALALACDRMLVASTRVIVAGDEAAIWSAKAKALWAAGGLQPRLRDVAHAESGIVHQDYPLLNPLLQLFSFTLAGRPLDFENRIPLQLCVVALLLAAAGALARCARPWVAGLLLVLLATAKPAREAVGDASADGLLALGLLVALEAAERWRTSGERRWFLLGVLALSVLVAGKNEGLMLALAVVAAVAVTGGLHAARRAARPAVTPAGGAARTAGGAGPALSARGVLWLLLPLALAATGAALNVRFGFSNDLLASAGGVSMPARLLQEGPQRLVPLLGATGAFLSNGTETQLLFVVAAVLLLLFPRRLLRRARSSGEASAGPDSGAWAPRAALPIVLLLALAAYCLVYAGAPFSPEHLLRTSLPRLLFQLLPALAVWLGAASTLLAAPSATTSAGSS